MGVVVEAVVVVAAAAVVGAGGEGWADMAGMGGEEGRRVGKGWRGEWEEVRGGLTWPHEASVTPAEPAVGPCSHGRAATMATARHGRGAGPPRPRRHIGGGGGSGGGAGEAVVRGAGRP